MQITRQAIEFEYFNAAGGNDKEVIKVITNNLLIKLKERNTENVEMVKSVLLSMQGKIDALCDLQAETDIRHGESSYDILLITRFSSMADMEAYLIHPVHITVSKAIASLFESVAAVCYEA